MVKEYRQKKVRKIMNTTLLIMAAGIGSRFGTGIKQLEPADASNQGCSGCQTPMVLS